jgi:hypothetical protein
MKIMEIEKFIEDRKKLHEAQDLYNLQDLLEFEKITKIQFAKVRSSMIVDLIRLNAIPKNEKKTRKKRSSMYKNKIEYLQSLMREIRIYKKRLERILN